MTNENYFTDNEVTLTIDSDFDLSQSRTSAEIKHARGQAAKLVAICVTAYPNSDKFKTKESVVNAVNLWANFFIDDDWQIVGLAVSKHVATSKWPPSIAEIREIMSDIYGVDIIPPDEAWAAVAKYIDNQSEYGGWEHPERLFPKSIITAVDAVGYRNLRDLRRRRYDHSGKKTGLDRVAFLQAYEPIYNREIVSATMPNHLKQAIKHTQNALSNGTRKLLDDTNANLTRQENERREMYERLERFEREKLNEQFQEVEEVSD